MRWSAASTKGALAVARYQVRIMLHGKTVRTVVVSSRLRSRLITGLKAHAGYLVSVRAGSWSGWGRGRPARASTPVDETRVAPGEIVSPRATRVRHAVEISRPRRAAACSG